MSNIGKELINSPILKRCFNSRGRKGGLMNINNEIDKMKKDHDYVSQGHSEDVQ